MSGSGYMFPIASSSPETLGRWLIETLAIVQPSPQNPARIQAWPGFGLDGKPDWVADSRVLGTIGFAKSPQEVLDYLQQQLDQAKALGARGV